MENYNLANQVIKIEKLFIGCDAKHIVLSSGECWALYDKFFRIDFISFPQKPFIVMEVADNLIDARNNLFEDVDPFPYDLDDEKIEEEFYRIVKGIK